MRPERYVKIKPNQRFNMVAIITQGGRTLSIGHNDYKRKSYDHKELNGYKDLEGLHAELDAIHKWKNKRGGATISIMGLTRKGNLLNNTYPCEKCLTAIKAVGINQIRYFENGEWKTERI